MKRYFKNLCVILSGLLCISAVTYAQSPLSENAALQAYNLRMDGKADQAKVLLQQALSENPDNAATYYELARTQLHMGLGNPRELENTIPKAQDSIQHATDIEPQNISYHLFAAKVAFMRGYFYIHIKGENAFAKEQFTKACEELKSTVKLKPDYYPAMLYLVELYGTLPEDTGGNETAAHDYAEKLKNTDKIFGAKAESILSEKDCTFWQDMAEKNPSNCEVLEELGKAQLRQNNLEDAIACFNKAVEIDPEKTYLFLDLSIHHTFSSMRAKHSGNEEMLKKHIAAGDAAVTKYLDSKPIKPMHAYALGAQSKYKFFSGNKEQADALIAEAKKLDPYFSRATGAPGNDLFIHPDRIPQNHRYLLRPY